MPLMEKFGIGDGTRSASSKRIIFSYVFDYIVIFALVIGFLALDAIEPFHQHFSLRNYTLQYPFAVHERIPNVPLAVISGVCPLFIIIFWTLVIDGIFSHKVDGRKRKYTLKDRLWELNCGILGLGLSISLQYVIVASLKNAIGKPRPDLIDRCQPKEGSADPLPFGLSTIAICTQTNHAILKDGFRSFPSGHSSTAFGGLFYLSLYIAAKLHILDSRGEVWKLFVVMTPTLGAALVAGSRIMDARHHPFDVITGSLIGMIFAWAAYRQYFPPVSDCYAKGRAYPMRSWGGEPLGKRQKEEFNYGYQQPVPQEDETVGASSSTAAGQPQRSESGNFFRDELYASQRQRRYDGSPNDPSRRPLDPSTSPPIGYGPAVTRRKIVDGNDLAAGEGAGRDEYEMQPHLPSQQPRGPREAPSASAYGHYEPYQSQTQPTIPRVGIKEEDVTITTKSVPPIGNFSTPESPRRKPGPSQF